ncbi:MAG TPA: isocitrate lyase/phosphoenolpyruvate mutase family protein [Jiangellaceae bacterium]|nr:isocitrate lyase/phosphoenolpyruvate mutase family protein [Jiangellaceae bacterium]
MTDEMLTSKARCLRVLHEGSAFTLANVWDAASAAIVAGLGAAAIGTTSGGIAWSHGRPDGQRLTRDDMALAVSRITAAVDVPVTADVEGGYGPATHEVAATVRAILDAGAVGINLEDSQAPGGPLFPVDEQVRRIRAARDAAVGYGVPELVINARTDVFLFGIGEAAGRLDEVQARTDAYAKAGANCLFVPGLLDLRALESLAAASPLPINAMAIPGGPTVTELSAAGVRRISVGTALAQVAYGALHRAANELLSSGTYDAFDGAPGFADLNSMFIARD